MLWKRPNIFVVFYITPSFLPSEHKARANVLLKFVLVSVSSELKYLNHDLFVYRDGSLTSGRIIMQTEQLAECFEPLQNLRERLAMKRMLDPPSSL